MKKVSPFLFLAATLFLQNAGAQVVTDREDVTSDYLGPKVLQIVDTLPGPPEKGSQRYRDDFETLYWEHDHRTKADCDRAESEAIGSSLSYFQKPYGPLTANEVKKLSPFFDRVRKDLSPALSYAKNHFHRPRPFQTNPELVPCVTKEDTPAYPSGHSTYAAVFSRILIHIFPERTDEILLRGDQIAFDRVVGGMHHPSDVCDSTDLGDRFAEALFESPKFNSDYSKWVQ